MGEAGKPDHYRARTTYRADFYPRRRTPDRSLAADWLRRSKLTIEFKERRQLSALSDQFARQIATTLSREAGLYTAHEMMESLDPNYHSELAETLMVECERLLDSEPGN